MYPNTLVAVMIALFLATLQCPAKAADASGSVLTLRGQCSVQRGGQTTPLQAAEVVEVGDVIIVPTGARLKLRMNDGSVISVGAGSRLTLVAYEAGTSGGHRNVRIDLAIGLLRAVVAAVAQPQHFEVDTATGVAAVRSTDWFVEASSNLTRVGVLKGVVTLAGSTTRKEVRIPARWGAKVRSGLDPVPPRLWSTAEFADVISRTDIR
jgi:hypothetical protein